MKLSPNVGSDRSWVWNAAADVSEGEPEPCTLAIRFANSDSMSCGTTVYRANTNVYVDANLFKNAFIEAQQHNKKLFGDEAEATEPKEEEAEEKMEAEEEKNKEL